MTVEIRMTVIGLLALFLSGCATAAIPYALPYAASVAVGSAAVGAIKGSIAASQVEEDKKTPDKTQLQIREIQTRMYETKDTKMVMKALLNVLQDDGFIVKDVNVELGFLTATKEIDIETKEAAFWGAFWGGTWEKGAIVEVTANVSEFGEKTRVRVNFQKKVYDTAGNIKKVRRIEDPKFYQEFFVKLDKGIFIQEEKL